MVDIQITTPFPNEIPPIQAPTYEEDLNKLFYDCTNNGSNDAWKYCL